MDIDLLIVSEAKKKNKKKKQKKKQKKKHFIAELRKTCLLFAVIVGGQTLSLYLNNCSNVTMIIMIYVIIINIR